MSASPLFRRFESNPILKPADVRPSHPEMEIACLLNPGAFRYGTKIGLLVRVAEGPVKKAGHVAAPLLDPASPGGVRVLSIPVGDPELGAHSDPRGFEYRGRGYITTLSHLRLAWSDDGVRFTPEDAPALVGEGPYEAFGIEDCRVEKVGDRYWLAYTAVSEAGVAVGMASTADWKSFTRHGLIFPPHNKDVAFFPETVGGFHWAFHRPTGVGPGGNYIWVARSPDMLHWGGHACVAMTRPGQWDGERIGAGASPIRTERGWLAIYHGADAQGRYCLGGLLLDLADPTRVLARSREPILVPEAEYEKTGFYGNVVFTNGHVLDGDRLLLYYGAADSVVCGAEASVSRILATLGEG